MKTMWRTMMILLALTIRLHAAADIKANNTTALNQTGSWVDGSVPTIANSDVATWDSTVTAANTVAIGGNLDVLGFKVTNPGGAVVISNTAGATLTLGSSGVDMSGAIQDLTLNPSLNIAAHQNWTVNGGRTLRGIAGTNVSSGSGTGNINMIQSGTGTALIIFNQNGNVGGGQTGWSNYSGNITVNTNVKVQSQGNNFVSFGSGTLTLAGGEIAQNSGNWTWSNTIDVSAASVIASDSGDSNPNGRSLKLISDLTSSNSSGLTFTMRNNTLPLRLNDANGFILAGANASTYGTTTISANTKVRVGGEGTTSLTGTGFNPGTRGSLGTGDVTLSAASSYLQFTWTDAHTVANNITGSGNVQIGGTGTGTIGSTNWNMSGTSTQVVTLSGASNYTGATTVKNGRLNLTGTLTSAITVDNGGSISGTGSTTQSLTLASGGKIALAGGATTTSIIVNGATFSGSNYIAFLDAPWTARSMTCSPTARAPWSRRKT